MATSAESDSDTQPEQSWLFTMGGEPPTPFRNMKESFLAEGEELKQLQMEGLAMQTEARTFIDGVLGSLGSSDATATFAHARRLSHRKVIPDTQGSFSTPAPTRDMQASTRPFHGPVANQTGCFPAQQVRMGTGSSLVGSASPSIRSSPRHVESRSPRVNPRWDSRRLSSPASGGRAPSGGGAKATAHSFSRTLHWRKSAWDSLGEGIHARARIPLRDFTDAEVDARQAEAEAEAAAAAAAAGAALAEHRRAVAAAELEEVGRREAERLAAEVAARVREESASEMAAALEAAAAAGERRLQSAMLLAAAEKSAALRESSAAAESRLQAALEAAAADREAAVQHAVAEKAATIESLLKMIRVDNATSTVGGDEASPEPVPQYATPDYTTPYNARGRG